MSVSLLVGSIIERLELLLGYHPRVIGILRDTISPVLLLAPHYEIYMAGKIGQEMLITIYWPECLYAPLLQLTSLLF